MKKLLFILSLSFISISFAQSENSMKEEKKPLIRMIGDAKGGLGFTSAGTRLYNITIGAQTVFKNNLYIRGSYGLGFGGGLTKKNATIAYTRYSLQFGYFNETKLNRAIVPYMGLAYSNLLRTTFRYDEVLNAANGIASGVGNLVGTDIDVKKRYLTEGLINYSIPVGVDVHFYGKKFGFVMGGYMNISQYQEFGVRLGMTFGKLK